MGNTRRQYSPQFKLQIVLELLKGEQSAAQIARAHGLGYDLLARWKDLFQERAPQIFQDAQNGANTEAARIAELARLVGQQAFELTLLKKGCVRSSPARSGER